MQVLKAFMSEGIEIVTSQNSMFVEGMRNYIARTWMNIIFDNVIEYLRIRMHYIMYIIHCTDYVAVYLITINKE